MLRVLVVDHDCSEAEGIARLLRARFEVELADDQQKMALALSRRYFDVALVDADAWSLASSELSTLLRRGPAPPILILMTTAGQSPSLPNEGPLATDLVKKPLDGPTLFSRIDRALESATVKRRLEALEQNAPTETAVAESDAMKRVLALADKVARTTSSSALLLGEPGVGKDLVAAKIHGGSSRARGPFFRMNLATIPSSMVEGELFGSERTPALPGRPGHFASAEGGTLFLDEIGDLRVEHQVKLLRALEEKRFFPVGSDRERPANVRVLAATTRDPSRLVAEGVLREDLYYRIGTVVIRVPPLRERADDILPLARHFADLFGRDIHRAPLDLSKDAEAALLSHAWPGNVRELRNLVERAVMKSSVDHVTADDLGLGVSSDRRTPVQVAPSSSSSSSSSMDVPELVSTDDMRLDIARDKAVTEFERAHISRVLRVSGGSRTRAAGLLGISRSTLYEKLRKYDLLDAKVGNEES